MNNPYQSTASMFGHFDHFKYLTTMSWFKPLFSDENIDKVILNFLDSFDARQNHNFEDVNYVLSDEGITKEKLLSFLQ